MTTLIIQGQTKAARAFLAYSKTLPFVTIKEDTTFENPSPSGDSWWNISENQDSVNRGIADSKAGRVKKLTAKKRKEWFGNL